MPRKGENIYKRKDGRWEGRYIRSYDSEHKAKYAYVYGKTYSEVKRKLTEQRGNVQKVQPTKNKSSTYGELLDCWLHSMQLNTKESTQARYTHLIKTHIKPHLGAVQLSQLTTDSSDSKGDYTGALVTRVKSLTNGISGQVLCSVNDIDEEYLFDQNTIVDLSRVSSLETKSLLMGVLILKLNEYRMCTSEENQPLRHVTVMEEAHNILKRSPTGGSEGSNVQAKSVEMISSAIAEMRTYGEGFIIVDQSPTAVDVSAVKNTNTKIIMRLPDYEDCKIAGLSMGLNDSQIREISRFPMGVAVVYQNNWVEAVLTQIDKSEEQYHQTDLITDDYALAVIKGQLAVELIFQYETGLLKLFLY